MFLDVYVQRRTRMKKSIVIITVMIILLVYIVPSLFAQEDWQQPSDASSSFIAIGVHGYPPEPNATNHGDFGIVLNGVYFTTYSTDVQDNVFAYTLSRHPGVLSETYVQEIGDFNNGSRRLRYVHPQCHISLAKCEWVYRRILGASANFNNNRLTAYLISESLTYRNLLISPEYIEKKCESDLSTIITDLDLTNSPVTYDLNGDGIVDTETEKIDTPKRLAEALYLAAWECPNTIRFFTHSMGGMFVLRYLAEEAPATWSYQDVDDDFFSGKSDNKIDYVPGYYKRNLDYSYDVDYQQDMNTGYHTDIIPTIQVIFNGNVVTPENPVKHATVGQQIVTSDNETTIKNALYEVFKKERENGVDKVIIQDGPLSGSPGGGAIIQRRELFLRYLYG